MIYWHILQHRWILITLCWVKENCQKKKDHILCNTIYMKFQKEQSYRDTKWISGCLGNGRWLLKGMRFLFGVMKMFQYWLQWYLYSYANILTATELYNLNEWIVWYVNCISNCIHTYTHTHHAYTYTRL